MMRLGRLIFAAIVPLCTVCAAKPVVNEDVRFYQIAQRYYDSYWQFHPVEATYTGKHGYDHQLEHYTPKTVGRRAAQLKKLLTELDRIDTTRLTRAQEIDYELVVSNVKMELFRLGRLRSWQTDPRLYADICISGVCNLLLRNARPLAERAPSIVQRMALVPQVLNNARRNVKTPSRIAALAAIDGLVTGEEFFQSVVGALGESLPQLKPRLTNSADLALAAMRSYRQELEQALPLLSDSFAMGKEAYDYLLKTEHFLDFDSDSLLALGENFFTRTDSAIRFLQRAREAYEREHPTPPEPFVPAPDSFARRDVIAAVAAEIESMAQWVRTKDLLTMPDDMGKLEVVETPVFLRRIIPGPAMEPPGALSPIQTSYYYMPPIPDLTDSATRQRYFNQVRRRSFRGGVVHEGYPGHHLQLSIANRNPSFVRRFQGNNTLIEGWALYCEQMVTEQGLYPDDEFLPLRWLGGVRFRAVRVILDVMLHTGRMSYDEAWRYMREKLGGDTLFYQGEVMRYCLSPTQPMSYLLGKTMIRDLRELYRVTRGEKYTLKSFHDDLLAQGSIPVPLVLKALIAVPPVKP